MDNILLENKEVIHTSIRTWEVLQNMVKQAAMLGSIFDGNYILSGCEVINGVVQPGVMMINGEILPFDSTPYEQALYVGIYDQIETVQGENGEYGLYKIRKVKKSIGSVGSHRFDRFNRLSYAHPQESLIELPGFLLKVTSGSGWTIKNNTVFIRIFINTDKTVRVEGFVLFQSTDSSDALRNIFSIDRNMLPDIPNFTLNNGTMFSDVDCLIKAGIYCETEGNVTTFKYSNASGGSLSDNRLSFVVMGKLI
jgi:hypothetical protein